MKRAILESPYAGDIKLHKMYARLCMFDMLMNHNEAPFASHMIYTQDHVLMDNVPQERELGMEAGFTWGLAADHIAVYEDLGISKGMDKGIDIHLNNGLDVYYRRLPEMLWSILVSEFGSRRITKSFKTRKTRIHEKHELRMVSNE